MEAFSIQQLSRMQIVRAIFLIVNILLALLQLFASYSPWGMARVVVAIAIVTFAMLKNVDENKPAVSYLCVLFALQCFTYLAVNLDAIAATFEDNALERYVTLLGQNPRPDITVLALAGFASFALGLMNKKGAWLTGVGGGLVGLALVLTQRTEGELVSLTYAAGGRAAVAVSVCLMAYWTFAVYVVCRIRIDLRSECLTIGLVLQVAFVIVNLSCSEYVTSIVSQVETAIHALPETEFSWWRVAITCVLLIVIGHVAHDEDEAVQTGWADENFLYACAVLVFGLRMLMNNFFPHSWLLYLALIGITLYAYSRACNFEKLFELNIRALYISEATVFTLFATLLCWGLLVNALVTAVFLLVLYYMKPKTAKNAKLKWTLLITFYVAEAFARMASWRLSVDGCILFSAIYAMALITIMILGMKHPAGKAVDESYYAVIAFCVALLCLCSLRSPIHVDATTEGAKVVVTAEAASEDSLKTRYVWKDAFGNKVTRVKKMKKQSKKIPIEGEILTVVAVDNKGVRCTRDFYYAPWMIESV